MTSTPQTLTTEDCEKLLKHLNLDWRTELKHRQGIRNYCMALLMLDAGLRVGEMVQLYIDNLYFMNEPVYQLVVSDVIAKNHKERIIPLSPRIRDAIKEMQSNVWSNGLFQTARWAFYSKHWHTRLTTRQVERIIRKAAMKSIGRPIHPHVLRHTFASRLMRTTNARVVQELLGHSHLSTTQIYTHPNQDDLKNAIHSLDRNHSNNEVTAARSTSTADIANGTDTTNANRDMR